MQGFIDYLADLVTRRRGPVLAVVALLTVATGIWIPNLVADPRPQELTASSLENQAEIAEAFRARFGNPDHVVVLLVQVEEGDVLAPEPLEYVHQLATTFGEREYVHRVEGITVTSLAYPVDEEEPSGGGTLDDLDEEGGGETLDDLDDEGGGEALDEDAGGETLDDLDEAAGGETLDDLGDEEEGDEDAAPTGPGQHIDPELEDALGALVVAAPEHFPMGLGSIAERLASVRYGPVVEGETIDEAERARLRRALEDAPLAEGRLISRDRTLTAVALFLDERVEDHRVMHTTVQDIDSWLAQHPPPDGVTVEVGGLPHLFHSIVVKMEHDNFRIIPATIGVCLLLLLISFRWVPGMILPVAAVGVTAVMVVGSMALSGETMNVVNNIIPPLLIIVGVSDSIHLIGRYREELEHSKTKMEAARNTVRVMAVACFLTSITTAVGLASLVTSQTGMLQRFGVIAGIGVMIAYFVTLGFLPAAMTYFKPPLTPKKHAKVGELQADRGPLERGVVALTVVVLRRPWHFLGGALVIFVGLVWISFKVDVDSALLDEFDPEDEAYTSTLLMEEKLEGVRPLEIMLESDDPGRFADPEVLAAVDETQGWLRDQRGVLGTLAVTDYLRETWARVSGSPEAREEDFRSRPQIEALMLLFAQSEEDPLEAFVTEDRAAGRIQVRLADIGAKRSLVIIEALRERLRERFEPLGIRVSLTGEGYTGSVGLEAIVKDLLGSLTTAVLIIFALIVFLFGSFRLGMLSIPPNLIPLVGTMAWMSWRGIPLNAATVIVFSISLGLSVDGSIHLLARYGEEIGKGIGRSPALVRSARGTGRAVIVSCVTLMLGFGVMLLSSFVPVRRFGELIAVSVGLCLISTLIIQPALLRVGAPKVPPNRFRRRTRDAETS